MSNHWGMTKKGFDNDTGFYHWWILQKEGHIPYRSACGLSGAQMSEEWLEDNTAWKFSGLVCRPGLRHRNNLP